MDEGLRPLLFQCWALTVGGHAVVGWTAGTGPPVRVPTLGSTAFGAMRERSPRAAPAKDSSRATDVDLKDGIVTENDEDDDEKGRRPANCNRHQHTLRDGQRREVFPTTEAEGPHPSAAHQSPRPATRFEALGHCDPGI